MRCTVCLEDGPSVSGVRCPGAARHFLCSTCLQTHVTTLAGDAPRLRASSGRVPCPAAGGGDADACVAAWTLRDLGSALSVASHIEFSGALVGILFDAPRAKVERVAARAAAEAAAREAGIALAERVHRLRLLVVERDLCLHCPACGAVFADYKGCNALTCGTCSAAFCGLCLSSFGSDEATHSHYYVVHQQSIHDKLLFERTHHDARLERVVAAVRAAGDASVQRALVAELAKADLAPLGFDALDVLQRAGVAAEIVSASWECVVCTLLNDDLAALVCKVCDAPRPATHVQQHAEQQHAGVVSDLFWTCASCTLHNDFAALNCDACTVPRPAAHAAVDALPDAAKRVPELRVLPAAWRFWPWTIVRKGVYLMVFTEGGARALEFDSTDATSIRCAESAIPPVAISVDNLRRPQNFFMAPLPWMTALPAAVPPLSKGGDRLNAFELGGTRVAPRGSTLVIMQGDAVYSLEADGSGSFRCARGAEFALFGLVARATSHAMEFAGKARAAEPCAMQ